MKRLIVATVVLVVAVLFSSVSESNATESRPLMLLIAGGLGREVGRTSMQRLYDEEFRSECDESRIRIEVVANKTFLRSGHGDFQDETLGYVKNHTNVVLIGHSFGGHAAYKIARFLLTEKPAARVFLLTLDPTSVSWAGRSSIAPSRWHNIYVGGFSGFSFIRWGYEPSAFRNYRFRAGGSFSDHFRVTPMFWGVREKVMRHLGYPCSNWR